jgi:chitinase
MFEHGDIDVSLFTHLIYCSFGVTSNGEITYIDEWLDIGKEFIKHFIELKSKNPNCKMMASVGGWNIDPSLFSQMAATLEGRSAFARNTLNFLNKHEFDGEKLKV